MQAVQHDMDGESEVKAGSKHLFPFLCRLSAEAIVLHSGFNALFSKLVNDYFKDMFFFLTLVNKSKASTTKRKKKKKKDLGR